MRRSPRSSSAAAPRVPQPQNWFCGDGGRAAAAQAAGGRRREEEGGLQAAGVAASRHMEPDPGGQQARECAFPPAPTPPAAALPAAPARAAERSVDCPVFCPERKAGDGRADTNVLVVGAKGSGKSTLVARFLNPDNQDAAKETMGLDYVFARRTSTGAQEKQVAHIWELGGGEDQANLMDAVITPENLRNFVCVVCVDLSQPSTVLDTLVFWMDRVRTRIDNCLRVMSDKKSTVPERLRERALAAFGLEHPDRELVNLCSVPIVVAATKFEAFQNEEAEYRKIMGRTLRFLAHVNGASLYYTSSKEKALLTQTRSVLSNLFFGGQKTGGAARHVVDHSKALAVRAGSDQISGIGAPPRVDTQGPDPVTPLDLYKHAFVSYFPPQPNKTESVRRRHHRERTNCTNCPTAPTAPTIPMLSRISDFHL